MKITFVPVGGLANRMRAMASAVHLSQETNSQLNVLWFKDWALNAPFSCLFESINDKILNLKETSFIGRVLWDRPRKKNLYLPSIFHYISFTDCIYERSFFHLIQTKFDFNQWVKKNQNVYMASYSAFQPYEQFLISKLFVPIRTINDKIEKHCSLFEKNTIGVHIRRTDNIASIEQSPLELFYKKLDIDIEIHDNTSIYLATDSEEVKAQMRQRYGRRIICSENEASRNSIEGIQEGVVDMYTLAQTKKIYGSYGSSFSDMAAQINGRPLEILKLNS
jgi:hypothetical protein